MSGSALRNGRKRVPDHRSDQSKVQVVYFDIVIPEHTGQPIVKLGESGDHLKRRKEHAKSKFGVKFDVKHLCMVRGTRTEEQKVLQYFAKHRIEGTDEEEIFNPHEDVVDYIRWLRDQFYVWVPDCDQCPDIEELDAVEPTLWLPSPERKKAPPLQNGLFPDDFGPLNLPPRETTIDDFYTSEIIIEPARRAMGGIDLDPASHAYANGVVKAKRFYSKFDNGLIRPWQGRVWLNPPFSEWKEWAVKILAEWKSGRVEAMCILSATRTLTAQYLASVHKNSSAICIFEGRIPFWGGYATPSPDDGHAVFYFGHDVAKFARAFGEIGTVYETLREAGS